MSRALWESQRPSGVVLSSGPVWSRPSDFPASDMKLSLTPQMVLFGFNAAFCLVFLLLPVRCDPCMNVAPGGTPDLCIVTLRVRRDNLSELVGKQQRRPCVWMD